MCVACVACERLCVHVRERESEREREALLLPLLSTVIKQTN